MHEDDHIRLKRSGGITYLGRPAMDLLDEIVRIAKERGYPDTIKTSNEDIKRICHFSNQSYWNARDKLIEIGIIQDYKNEEGPYGTYFLNYEFTKNYVRTVEQFNATIPVKR